MRIIAAKSKRDRPVQGSDWLDELGIESLDVVEMIFELEDCFGVEIPVNANTDARTKAEPLFTRVVKSSNRLSKPTDVAPSRWRMRLTVVAAV